MNIEPIAHLDHALEALRLMFEPCAATHTAAYHQGHMKGKAIAHIIGAQSHLRVYLRNLAENMRDALPPELTCGLDEPWGEGFDPPILWMIDALAQIVDPGISKRIESPHAIDNDISEDAGDFRGDR